MVQTELSKSITANIERFKDADLSILFSSGANVQPWQNSGPEHVQVVVEHAVETFRRCVEHDLLGALAFNYLNGINQSLINFWQQLGQIAGLKPAQVTNQHHNPLNQLHSAENVLRSCGVYAIARTSPDIDKNSRLIEGQLSKLTQSIGQADQLKEQVKKLLNPSVADALSKAFGNRRRVVARNKFIWLLLLGVGLVGSTWLTMSLKELLESMLPTVDAAGGQIQYGALAWVLRFALLLPAYAFTIFAISQYRRERQIEENYAHKSAIAETLPSYNEIIRDPATADVVTQSMTSVVFKPPLDTSSAAPSATPQIRDVDGLVKSVMSAIKAGVGPAN